MKRLVCVLGLAIAMLGVAGLSSRQAGAQDEKKKEQSISGIMKRLHGKEKGALASAKTALAADPVDWTAVKKASRPIAALSKAMAVMDPPKGDKESFEKLSNSYHDNAVLLVDAAKSEDAPKAKEAVGKLGMSCGACHKAHKP